MRRAYGRVCVAALCVLVAVPSAWAIPVTWQASGVIDFKSDSEPYGELDLVVRGMPWTLTLTFDPDAPGRLLSDPASTRPPTYVYKDAVSSQFTLGSYEYTSLGDIFVNADLPWLGTSTDDGKPGLVQFQILDRWTGGAGGPDLNAGLGLMLASYNDANTFDGSLPSIPVLSAEQGLFGGLLWTTLRSYPGSDFGSNTFNPAVVPEPTSLLLLGSGVALLATRRLRRSGRV